MECSIQGCEDAIYSGGLCSRHYNRLRTTGTTNDGPRARKPFLERLWAKIEKREPDQCWPWVGDSWNSGYGTLSTGGRPSRHTLAHRAVWEQINGPLSDGVVIRHRCNNRFCCNPLHLQSGTLADNVADMWENTESPRGNARLSEEQVQAIRKDPRSSRNIAPEYGVSHAHIRSIRQGRAWK